MRRVTYSPRKWERLPVEDDEQQQQHPRCSARARQKRLHQGRPVDAPCSVTHRSDGHGDDGDSQGEPANPGGRHGSIVMASTHLPFARIGIWRCLGLRRAHRVRDRVTLRLPKGGAGHFWGVGQQQRSNGASSGYFEITQGRNTIKDRSRVRLYKKTKYRGESSVARGWNATKRRMHKTNGRAAILYRRKIQEPSLFECRGLARAFRSARVPLVVFFFGQQAKRAEVRVMRDG